MKTKNPMARNKYTPISLVALAFAGLLAARPCGAGEQYPGVTSAAPAPCRTIPASSPGAHSGYESGSEGTETPGAGPVLVSGKVAISGAEILKLVAEGKYEEARSRAITRITEMPTDIDAYVALAWSLVSLGDYQNAETYALRGYGIYKDPRLAQAIGEASYNLGKNDVALAMLQEYIAAYPEGPRTGVSYYICGELYIRKAQFMHADIAFSTAVRYSPNNPQWWARLGWARENAHRQLQALSAYEQALALDPNFQDAVEGRKRILGRLQE